MEAWISLLSIYTVNVYKHTHASINTNLLQAVVFDGYNEFDFIYQQIHENWTPLKIAFWASENVGCAMGVKR